MCSLSTRSQAAMPHPSTLHASQSEHLVADTDGPPPRGRRGTSDACFRCMTGSERGRQCGARCEGDGRRARDQRRLGQQRAPARTGDDEGTPARAALRMGAGYRRHGGGARAARSLRAEHRGAGPIRAEAAAQRGPPLLDAPSPASGKAATRSSPAGSRAASARARSAWSRAPTASRPSRHTSGPRATTSTRRSRSTCCASPTARSPRSSRSARMCSSPSGCPRPCRRNDAD